MSVWFEKALPFRTLGPGVKMPPSTAVKMAAAMDVNHTLNTHLRQQPLQFRVHGKAARRMRSSSAGVMSPCHKANLSCKWRSRALTRAASA